MAFYFGNGENQLIGERKAVPQEIANNFMDRSAVQSSSLSVVLRSAEPHLPWTAASQAGVPN
jgi:hypothetical protein